MSEDTSSPLIEYLTRYFDEIPLYIQECVRDNNLVKVLEFIESKQNPFVGRRIILFAVFVRQSEMVKYLINNDTSVFTLPNVIGIEKESLDLAVYYDMPDIAIFLVEERHMSSEFFHDPIFMAIGQGNVWMVRYLHKRYTGIVNDISFIYECLKCDKVDCLAYFLEEQHFNIYTNTDQYIFQRAMLFKALACIRYLVEQGINIHDHSCLVFYDCVSYFVGLEIMEKNRQEQFQKDVFKQEPARAQIIEYLIEQGVSISFEKNYNRNILLAKFAECNVSFFCILVKTGGLDLVMLRQFMTLYHEELLDRHENMTAVDKLKEMQFLLVDYILTTFLPLSNVLGDSKADTPDTPGLFTVLFDNEFQSLKNRPEIEFLRLLVAVLNGFCPQAMGLISMGVFVRLTRILKAIPLDRFARRRQAQLDKVETSKAFIAEKTMAYLALGSSL
jgi:hypothetical protein